MPTSEQILENASRVHGAAEVFAVESERRYVSFEANKAKNIGQSQSSGVALRIINRQGKIGFSSTTDASKSQDLVQRVGDLATYGAEAKFEFPSPSGYPKVESSDPNVAGIRDEEMIRTGESIIEQILAEFPDALCSVDISKTAHQQRLLNSSGVDISYDQTACGVSMGVELIRGTDMLSVWDGHYSAAKFDEDATKEIVQRTLRRLRLSQRIVDGPSGKDIPVVFTPVGFVGAILPPLLAGFDGKNVASGSSPLIDRWGEKMLDSRISIADDPLRPLAAQTHPADDEGIPSRRLKLIDNGKICEPVLDLQTAGEIGMPPTGSGMRGLATTPSPSTSFIEIEGGDTDPGAMCDGIGSGIIVELLLGAGQGNELGGDFRANVSLGFLIENGEPVGRIKDTMISGNVYTALNEIEAISSTPEFVYGTRMAPTVRCRGIEVAAS